MPPQQPGEVDWGAEADKIRTSTSPAPSGVTPPPGSASPAAGAPDWSAVADGIKSGKIAAPFEADPNKLPFLQRPPASSGRPLISDADLWSGMGNLAEMGAMVAAPEVFGPGRGVPLLTRIAGRMFAAGTGGAAARTARTIAQGQTDTGHPLTPGAVAGEAGGAFVQGATGEAIGGGMSATGRLARSIPTRILSAPPSAQGVEASAMLGGHVTPAQQSERWGTAITENALRGSLFSGGKWVDYFNQQKALLGQKADEILTQFGGRANPTEVGATYARAQAAGPLAERRALETGARTAQGSARQAQQGADTVRSVLAGPPGPPPTPETAGDTWLKLLKAKNDAADAVTKQLYAEVWPLAEQEGVRVPVAPLADYAQQTIAQQGDPAMQLLQGPVKKAFGVVRNAAEPSEGAAGVAAAHIQRQVEGGASPEFIQALRDTYAGAGITEADQASGTLNLEQAKNLRTQLGYRIPNDKTGHFKQLYGRLSEAIKTATTDAEGNPTAAGRAFQAATDQAREVHHTFEEGLLADVVKKEPRLVIDTLVKPNRVQELKDALNVVGPEGQQTLAQAHMQDLLKGKNGAPATSKELRARINDLSWDTITTLHGHQVRPLLEGLSTLQDTAAQETANAAKLTAQAGKVKVPALTPAQAFGSLIKGNNIDEVTKARALLAPQDWQKVQAARAQDILFNADGTIKTGNDIAAATTDPAFKVAYPNGEGDGLAKFARVVKYLQRPQPGATAPIFRYGQGAIILGAAGLAYGNVISPKTAAEIGVVTLTPAILTRVLLNPGAREWLTTGIAAQAKGDTGVAARMAGQLSAWVGREVYRAVNPPPAAPVAPSTPGTGRGSGPGPVGTSVGPPPKQ
ncbi:MAG TPA: hypothetical protein VN903_17640 [Polyangia bacterium]|nr:hypothetical protein [Polyangia bacterium]